MRRLLAGSVVALAAVLSAVVSVGVTAGPANAAEGAQVIAADDAEQALAERFAPVVRLVHQDVECGPGEPYQPSDVELVLGDPSVALRGPWAEDDIDPGRPDGRGPRRGPLRLPPGLPRQPARGGVRLRGVGPGRGCGPAPTTYAHVATEVGRDDRLALQYWFFYPFNDYTNKHEGDWEMVQLVFAAADAAEALDQTPIEVGYSQHEGLEVAEWDDPKLEIVDGTHPGRAPRRRLARQLLRGRALPRHVRRAGVRLRRHPRPGRRPEPHRRRHPERPGGRAGRVPVDRVPGPLGPARGGVLQRADRPEHQGRAGPTRSATRSRTAATSATPCPPAASSAPRPPTSSAAPSRAARRSSASSPTTPRACS